MIISKIHLAKIKYFLIYCFNQCVNIKFMRVLRVNIINWDTLPAFPADSVEADVITLINKFFCQANIYLKQQTE